MIKLKCEICDVIFYRSKSEVNRNLKLGRRTFCSRSCCGKATIKNLGSKRVTDHLKKGSERDEYSPFRVFLKSIRSHNSEKSKPIECSIDLIDLKNQWEKQKGICPYTGWTLVAPETTQTKLLKTPDRASLDRIDSSKGYVQGNIQFVSLIAQYAKNDWHENELFKFSEAVINHVNSHF